MNVCKHDVPYEYKCQSCTAEALERVKTLQQAPASNATAEEKSTFWKQAYSNTQPKKEN